MKFIFTDHTINSIDELLEQKVVYVTVWERTCPVAFLQYWQGRVLKNFVKAGRFKYYNVVKLSI